MRPSNAFAPWNHFGITSVEQPVAHEQVAALAAIRKAIQTPMMLDESLCGMVDAERAVEGGWCDLFNLRLSKCGGFIPSLRLAQFAKRHGLGYQLGCQVGETAILSAAGRHFASAVKDIRFVEGSYDRHLVWESLSPSDLTFGRGGWAPMLVGAGLGTTIDPARVDWVTVAQGDAHWLTAKPMADYFAPSGHRTVIPFITAAFRRSACRGRGWYSSTASVATAAGTNGRAVSSPPPGSKSISWIAGEAG